MEALAVLAGSWQNYAWRVTVVGRSVPHDLQASPIQCIVADLSLTVGHDDVINALGGDPIDLLVFTAGGFSPKSRVTSEGKDASWMVNHVARKRILAGVTSVLSDAAQVAFISNWGTYKKAPPLSYEYGLPGRDGMQHVINSYIPNDTLFFEFSKSNPGCCVLGYNPGQTSGTQVMRRAESPWLLKLIAPLIDLFARPVENVASEFLACIDASGPGMRWVFKGKEIAAPDYLN